MIRVQNLSFQYGRQEVLQNISFRIRPGEWTGVLGPNGSGKTTLLLAVAGILRPAAGKIEVAGRVLEETGHKWRAMRMASVPQKAQVTFPFQCLSVVLMGRYPYLARWGGYTDHDRKAVFTAMEDTQTLHLARRLITEVSGGEAQRIVIARALAQETPALLLDEATSSLDAARKIQIFDLLRQKNRVQNLTLLCAMHDLNLAALYCRRIIFLKQGKIALDGPTEETFNEKSLSDIYEADIRVSRHPVTGDPQAHFVPGLDRSPDALADDMPRPHVGRS